MQTLIDCDILDYCHRPEDYQDDLEVAIHSLNKPVYGVSVFELCRALHLLVKLYGIPPTRFRACWVDLTQIHYESAWGNGGCFLHVNEFPIDEIDRLPVVIRTLRTQEGHVEDETEVPCESDPVRYWDRHLGLTKRLRELHQNELVDFQERLKSLSTSRGPWIATPPQGEEDPPCLRSAPENEDDVVMDTNNLLELLDQLPEDGAPIDGNQLHLPSRLSDNAKRRFKRIINNRGVSGKFIVPVSVLEEVDRVAFREWGNYRSQHLQAQAVLRSMSLDPDRPMWQVFSFESLTQEIFDYLLLLYEKIADQSTDIPHWPDFGDALVLAHGLYHGCPVASNEWYEKDDWDAVKSVFPHLVLE